jgi:hypothetical protein
MDTEIINLNSILADFKKKIVDLEELNQAKLTSLARQNDQEIEEEREEWENILKGMLIDRKKAKEAKEKIGRKEEEVERVRKEMERFKRNARGRVTGRMKSYFRTEEQNYSARGKNAGN